MDLIIGGLAGLMAGGTIAWILKANVDGTNIIKTLITYGIILFWIVEFGRIAIRQSRHRPNNRYTRQRRKYNPERLKKEAQHRVS